MANDNQQQEQMMAELRAMIREEVALALMGMAEPKGMAFLNGAVGGGNDSAVSDTNPYAGETVGECGTRDSDLYQWRHTGSGTVTIKNVAVSFDSVVTMYADSSVAISGTKYVYAEVTWTKDGDDVITGITSVTIGVETSFANASKKLSADAGYRAPLYQLKLNTTTNDVECVKDYVRGVVVSIYSTAATGGGGGTTGYTETTVPIIWQYDTSAHKWQYKTGTVLVKNSTTAATWTDGITFAQFSD